MKFRGSNEGWYLLVYTKIDVIVLFVFLFFVRDLLFFFLFLRVSVRGRSINVLDI